MKINIIKTLSEIAIEEDNDNEIMEDWEIDESIQNRMSIENMLSF